MSKINITEILDKHCKENHIEIYGNQLKAIKATMHEAIEAAIDKCAEVIETGYDFDGEWKSENNPKGIVNQKVNGEILNVKNLIDYK